MLEAEKCWAGGCSQVGSEDVPAQESAVKFQGAEGYQEEEEPAVVSLA